MEDQFGKQVRLAREAKGWSQETLAEAVGATQSTIDRIERGFTRRSRVMPDIATTLKLEWPPRAAASAFDKPKRELMQKLTIVIPTELYERLTDWQELMLIGSENEAIRRLIEEGLARIDTFFTIVDRLFIRYEALKSWRVAAGDVLSSHPNVISIEFPREGGLNFKMDDGFQVEVGGNNLIKVFDEHRARVIFTRGQAPRWADPSCIVHDRLEGGWDIEVMPF